MGTVCVDMGAVAPFRDCLEDDGGVDDAYDETPHKKHQKEIAKWSGQTQLLESENIHQIPEHLCPSRNNGR
jgi:hypothetical protein